MKDDDDDRCKVRARPPDVLVKNARHADAPLTALFLHTPYRGKVFCRPNWRGHMYHHPFQICSKPIQFNLRWQLLWVNL